MEEISFHLRLIYLRYLLIAIGFIICYSTFRWYFDYKLNVLHLNEVFLLDTIIPLYLICFLTWIWLIRELEFFALRSKLVGLYITAVSTIFITNVTTQNYIKASISQLKQVDSPYEITEARNIDCYEISDFNVVKEYVGAYKDEYNGGKGAGTVYRTTYFVVPIVDHNQQIDFTNHKYWYGFKFTESKSNYRVSIDSKNERSKAFFEECVQEYKKYNYSNFEYLQGLTYSSDRDGYIEAIKWKQQNNNTENLIIFEPIKEPFENKVGKKLEKTFFIFVIGAFAFLLMVFFPTTDLTELRRYEAIKLKHNTFNKSR